MSPLRPALLSVLCAAALSACGTIAVKPTSVASRGRVDDQRLRSPNHVSCLRGAGLPVTLVDPADLVVGGGVRVHFEPTPGSAQADQIQDREQGAEVIGSALLYPGAAPDSELSTIERCLTAGVKG